VSINHKRWSWGIELSRVYLVENAIPRVQAALKANRHTWDDVPVNHHAEPKLVGTAPPSVKIFNL
jgi:hypothetical protein